MVLITTSQLLCIFSLFETINNVSGLAQVPCEQSKGKSITNRNEFLMQSFESMAMMSVVSATVLSGSPAFADEIGRENEAPTLFTGETVMICTKRGPLGACTKTETRTEKNDNDKADKYFKDPGDRIKKDNALMAEELEGNVLIKKLRQQSIDNKEQNDLIVLQRTLINDQSASFGPFSKDTAVLNTDGRTFTLLANPQAMRLKKAGFIKDKKFLKQPTEQELEDALPAPDDGGIGGKIGGFFTGIFGESPW